LGLREWLSDRQSPEHGEGLGDSTERREGPPPRDDPPTEPSHRAARIADRERGEERGDKD
jgi:hypothetical protein